MRIDVVSIFPGYFDALELSLLGKAKQRGVIDVRVHDLREHAHDKHRTVDDTPAGGGAGMVMKPEPWGEALDSILTDPETTGEPLIIFPSPAGEVFTQAMAHELAQEPHLVFGCGRYEGIDQRVFEEYAERGRVRLVSIGDYILNGGEVATIAMVEAIARLVPGVVGNPESLVEESHESGLLEYPSYTKPANWRDRAVPPVLLSGNHAAIAAWRQEQSIERTRRVRPELLPPEHRGESRGRHAAD
ncbi:tRNA (guanosine(37)-N1)-methyltransferase TrmD [Leucobacter luti]|uniref:tRNA (guanine-N(1)-)-methyltransferase n=1 Tax=Leucobacter luti TaxID=340320 RepID=A0A4V6MCJ5_9MICO|nr:tRNA (guanosine(37)-N1)-methyltransferase TrmD [Leucobacter luti]MBL3698127.1 tRNA (guanosine(37)-N1)-methyltransferase TrmD [Leucobacter luti]RZT64789.1 tRNA (guanine37-N(1)-) methyltransferase [Leucobacter luti]